MISFEKLKIRKASANDSKKIENLLVAQYLKYMRDDYTEKGRAIFSNYISSTALNSRISNGCYSLVAEYETELVGYVEIENYSHLTLLFVDDRFHRNGIAKLLFSNVLEICKTYGQYEKMTVNSSRYAKAVYEKFGFAAVGGERFEDGILAIPMTIRFNKVH